MKLIRSLIILLLATTIFACGPSGTAEGKSDTAKKNPDFTPAPYNGGIKLPENFGAILVTDKLADGRARHIDVRENGDIYVNLRRKSPDMYGKMALRDTNGDGIANMVEGFNDKIGTGMVIHNNYLYYSVDEKYIVRAPLLDGELLPDESQVDTLVYIPHEGGHMAKSITLDGKGKMYVNVGSLSNACQEKKRSKGSKGIDPCVELETRAGIWQFSDNVKNQTQEDGIRYATGIRNAVALEWDDHSNSLYCLQHGRDDLHRFWPAYYSEADNVELPSEEFFQVSEGDDFGWPYCYYNHFEQKKLLNPEYGGDGVSTERCEGIKNPIMGFPGHWAPNDLVFYNGDMFPEKYKHGAFIAFHGSWNRLNNDQAGFCVVFVPMKDGKPTGDYEIFADNFEGTSAVREPGNARFRPTGLAIGADGSLYITDSQQGRIWRVFHYPEGVPEVEGEGEEQVNTLSTAKLSPELLAGQKVYEANCQACHQASGNGVAGMNPPLAGTEWVTGDKERLIGVILNGMNEPIEIKGEKYQNVMAAHDFLSDQEIADVLTYIRQSFGNSASAITKEEVASQRAES